MENASGRPNACRCHRAVNLEPATAFERWNHWNIWNRGQVDAGRSKSNGWNILNGPLSSDVLNRAQRLDDLNVLITVLAREETPTACFNDRAHRATPSGPFRSGKIQIF